MDPIMLNEIKELLTIYGGGYKERTKRICSCEKSGCDIKH